MLNSQRYDASGAKHYNYFRDYDPVVGRYVQSDPVGMRGGLNTYLYALANPIRRYDSNGLTSITVDISHGMMFGIPPILRTVRLGALG